MTKYKVQYSNKFKKDTKKISKKELELVQNVIECLANDEILEEKYHDHKLQGNWFGFRECHIKPDLLLIYRKNEDRLILTAVRFGSHSDLF